MAIVKCNPLDQHAEDYTLCPICKDDFTDPRSPPCLHTFCLKCLKGFCRDRGPGEEVKCPLCRKEFNIPQNGVDRIQKNFIIRDLQNARKETIAKKTREPQVQYTALLTRRHRLISRSLVVTDALLMDLSVVQCLKDNINDIEQQPTQQSKVNKLLTVLRNVPRDQSEKVIIQFLSALRQDGQEHVANIIHSESDARHMSYEHYQLLISKYQRISQCLDPLNGLVDELVAGNVFSDRDRRCVMSQTGYDDMSREVLDILVLKPDSAFDKFIAALSDTNQKRVASLLGLNTANIPMSDEHYQRLISKKTEISEQLECDERLVDQLLSSGVFSDVDATRVRRKPTFSSMALELVDIILRKPDTAFDDLINTLHATGQGHVAYLLTGKGEPALSPKSVEILRSERDRLINSVQHTVNACSESRDVCSDVRSDDTKVRFTSFASCQLRTKQNIISTDVWCPQLLFSHSISGYVWGVTQCDNKLFVVCSDKHTQSSIIHVFKPDNKQPTHQINIELISQPTDIVSCAESEQLYVAGRSRISGYCVWRVSLDGRQVVKWLPVKSALALRTQFAPRTLSVTSRRLLVTSRLNNELLLYGADGVQLRRVPLPDMKESQLQHAVETSRGTFVVSHSLKPRVCEVDANGDIICVYSGQLDDPCYLSSDSDGRIFVADWGKHRILLLNSHLELERVLLDTQRHRLTAFPYRLCYTEVTRQLVVATEGTCSELSSPGCVQLFALRSSTDSLMQTT